MMKLINWIIWVAVVATLIVVFFFVPFRTGKLEISRNAADNPDCVDLTMDMIHDINFDICFDPERKTLFHRIFGGGN
jgi:hypothetical protein